MTVLYGSEISFANDEIHIVQSLMAIKPLNRSNLYTKHQTLSQLTTAYTYMIFIAFFVPVQKKNSSHLTPSPIGTHVKSENFEAP